jgi:hypothetical protein
MAARTERAGDPQGGKGWVEGSVLLCLAHLDAPVAVSGL